MLSAHRVTVHLFVDQIIVSEWARTTSCARKLRKRRGVLRLARVPKDLEEAKDLEREKETKNER